MAHVHDAPVPEEYHHIRPQCRGGLARPDNMVWLCANAHSDVHYFLDLIEKRARAGKRHPEAVEAAESVHYGPKIKQFARLGWSRYAAEFLAGDFDAHALLWDTAGRPAKGAPAVAPPFTVAAYTSEVDYWLRLARQHLRRGLSAD